MKSAKDLIVYQKAYALAIETFEASRRFSAEERYSFTIKFGVPRGLFVQIFEWLGRNEDMKRTLYLS
jgi:hypothetical protein